MPILSNSMSLCLKARAKGHSLLVCFESLSQEILAPTQDGFAEALETKEEKRKCFSSSYFLFVNVTSFLSLNLFLNRSLRTKKGGKIFCFATLFYGCFLVTRIASTAPMMIMMMAIATIPYMTVVFEAKPVSGVAVGAGVGGAGSTAKVVSEEDGQYPFVPRKFAYTV